MRAHERVVRWAAVGCLVAVATPAALLGVARRRTAVRADLLDHLDSGLVVTDRRDRLVVHNAAGRRLLPDLTPVWPALRRARAGEEVVEHLAIGGRVLAVRAVPQNGGAVLTVRDISAVDLLDLAPDAVLLRAADDRILYCNRAAEAMYGWSRAELTGQVAYEVLDVRFPMSRQAAAALLRRAGTWSGEITQRRRDGRRLTVLSRQAVRTDPAGRPVAIIEINSDITARRHAESQLRASQEQQRLLLEGAGDHAILMLDRDGLVTSWSTSAERLHGYTAEEAVGRPYASFFTAEDARAGVPEQVLARAESAGRAEAEGSRIRRDGTVFWANAVLTAVHNDDGTLRGFVKVTRDMSDRRRAEQEIIQLNSELRQLDQLKTDLIATVSHELRTPLTSIRGYTELLIDGEAGDLEPVQRRMINVIDSNGARLLSLVEDLLAFSRVDAGTFSFAAEPIDLAQIIAAAVPAGAPLRQEIAPDLPLVTGDPEHLSRALRHVLNNAVKFSPDGGEIVITARREADGVTIEVADQGIGIAEDEQDRLFQRFFRSTVAQDSHIQGAGLGLAMVKTVMDGHGGRVGLRSTLGAGTTVTLWLPSNVLP